MPRPASPRPGIYPFWFWNGTQEEAVLSEQLRRMKAGGCRGVVLHSREGNRIPYLSDRWLELVAHACECARQLGLTVWLYDEDGYPSGNAGMQVQKLRPDLRQKHLAFAYAPTDPDAPCFAAFDATTYARLDETAVPMGTTALRFTLTFTDRHVDTFSREAADLFVSLTHDRYERRLGAYFGDPVEAVYTDDQSYQVWHTHGVPWSEVLDAEYRRRHGRELSSLLPLLVEDLPGAADVRFRFYTLARELFLNNFIAPQVAWCERHGLAYLGHLCGDEGPSRNAVKNFGTMMPFLMAEHVPSIDDYLCELKDHGYLRVPLNDGESRILAKDERRLFTHLIYKAASSVANQFKDGLVSAENLTFLGWDVQPDFLNTQTLFELAHGVNLMTPHAYYYTIGDGAKRDCPPSYFTQQPFHGVFGRRCETWTRIAELLLRGTAHADTLVVFPDRLVASQTGRDLDPRFEPRLPRERMGPDEFDLQFGTLLMELARRHIGYELGEDSTLAETSRVVGGTLVFGRSAYRTVAVLSGIALAPETTRLLHAFQAGGGCVLTLPPAGFAALDDLAPDLPLCGEGAEEIFVHARDNAGFREAFLLNLSGRTLDPSFAPGVPFTVYDPVEEVGFRADGALPVGFVLEKGACCAVLPPDFDCRVVPFGSTAYRGHRDWTSLTPAVVSMARPNAIAFHATSSACFELEAGATVRAVYAERLAEAGLRVNGVAARADDALPPHPCAFCFEGVSVAAALPHGPNRVELGSIRDMIYLEGEFVVEGTTLKAARAPGLGDLAQAGWPHYWGGVDYTFEFEGKRDLLSLELAGGAAEVSVNGAPASPVFGQPAVVRIADLCSEHANTVVVRLFNTAANFVVAKAAPFGVLSCAVA